MEATQVLKAMVWMGREGHLAVCGCHAAEYNVPATLLVRLGHDDADLWVWAMLASSFIIPPRPAPPSQAPGTSNMQSNKPFFLPEPESPALTCTKPAHPAHPPTRLVPPLLLLVRSGLSPTKIVDGNGITSSETAASETSQKRMRSASTHIIQDYITYSSVAITAFAPPPPLVMCPATSPSPSTHPQALRWMVCVNISPYNQTPHPPPAVHRIVHAAACRYQGNAPTRSCAGN
ncbi:hypothetical protein E2C01_007760 [Portunus trituberculatus]|uniref:Uncharacterized protein n=1 Tax=Portunus trituberculatus TaxID=210409 RepID=A0A5B7D1A3_PORTR|nr:hypothetical protein [Portunus trituberculatus]